MGLSVCATCHISVFDQPADQQSEQREAGREDGQVEHDKPALPVEARRGRGVRALQDRPGPWRKLEAVEYDTLEWIDWFNHRRLLEPIGNIQPVEAEEQYYAAANSIGRAA